MPMRLPLLTLLAALPLAAAPCSKAAAECTERLPLGEAGGFTLFYRNHSLAVQNAAIERALIVVHGAGRNADDYFASAMAAAFLANSLENTIVIAPRFASSMGSCKDKLAPAEISWTCSGPNDWRGGGPAADGSSVNAFDVVDRLLRILARPDLFPNLKSIVVTGHSAGGQFVNRYALLGRGEKTIRVHVQYIVANPSSYLYLDDKRLAPEAACSEKGGCSGPFAAWAGAADCPSYNRWKYGLAGRTGYAGRVPESEMRANIGKRDVTYLLGEFDTLPVYGFDDSCAAAAQGPSRLARGINYWNYLKLNYGALHKLVIVPACGHNGRCMYTSNTALPLLFPPQ